MTPGHGGVFDRGGSRTSPSTPTPGSGCPLPNARMRTWRCGYVADPTPRCCLREKRVSPFPLRSVVVRHRDGDIGG